MLNENLKNQLSDKFYENLKLMLGQALKPSEKLNIIEWAERNYTLPSTMALPGLYNSDFTPYQKEILNVTAHVDEAHEVVLLMGSQTGKTHVMMILLAYWIVHKPSLIKFLLPMVELGDSVSQDRLTPMIEGCKPLASIASNPEKRDGKSSIRRKQFFNGASLTIGCLALLRDLTSTPSRICLIDELSKYVENPLPSQQDPVSLVRQRQETFYDSKLILASTPLDEGNCLITENYINSKQGVWENQCLQCKEYFAPKWNDVKWNDGGLNARIVCPCCGFEHDDNLHKQFVKQGRWVYQYPENKRYGFFVNSLSSPFTDLNVTVQTWLQSQGDPAKLKQFVTEKLAETWKNGGDSLGDSKHILAGDWDSETIPNNCLYLTAGVDTQGNRFEAVIQAWAEQDESYTVKRIVVQGSPDSKTVQDQLAREILADYRRSDGVRLKMMRVCVDSGGQTSEAGAFSEIVKAFCKRFARYNFIAVKGSSTKNAPIWNTKVKNIIRDKVSMIGVHNAKELLYHRLQVKADPEKSINPGACHFSAECDPDFFSQLLDSEKRVITVKGSKKEIEWLHDKKIRNEVLDCTVYSMAANYSLPYSTDKKQSYSLKMQLERKKVKEVKATEEKQLDTTLQQPIIEPKVNKYSKLLKK